MCDRAKIIRLMEEKCRLLRAVEEATQEMITCSSEQLEAKMTQRDRLVESLEKADREMKELCADGEDGPAILEAAMCRGEPERLDGTPAEVYRIAQQMRAVLARLRESELQAVLRLKQEQLEILEKIKTAGQSGAAKAARFYSLSGAQGGGSSRLGKA